MEPSHQSSNHQTTMPLDVRLRQHKPHLIAVNTDKSADPANFEPAFHQAAAYYNLEMLITHLRQTYFGFEITVNTLGGLAQLWHIVDDLELKLGWALRPLPPARLWMRLTNLPRDIAKSELRAALFEGCNEQLAAIRHLQEEIKIHQIRGRIGFLTCPPEFRAALQHNNEVTVRVRLVRIKEHVTVRVCKLCSKTDHPSRYCRTSHYCCNFCGAEGHTSTTCDHRDHPAYYCCPNCQASGQPLHLQAHAANDAENCPFLQQILQTKRDQQETRPEVYRELMRFWHTHRKSQTDLGRPQDVDVPCSQFPPSRSLTPESPSEYSPDSPV